MKLEKQKNDYNFLKIILAALGFTILSQVIRTVGSFLTMGYYQDISYLDVWSDFMKSGTEAPRPEFYLLSITFYFVNGLIFSSIYAFLKDKLPGEGLLQKGFIYGFIVFLLAGVTVSLTMVLLINLPFPLIFYWTVESLILYLVNGALAAAVISGKKD